MSFRAHLKKSIAAHLFFLFLISYAYFYPGGGHNEAARYDTIRAILHDHSFIVDRFAYNSADLIRFENHYYSSKAPGTTFVGLPAFGLLEVIFTYTPYLKSLPDFLRDHWICYWTSVITVAVPCALAMIVLYWLALKLLLVETQAALVTIAIGLGTIYFPFATLFFSHAVTAALVLTAFYQIFSCDLKLTTANDIKNSRWRVLLAGAALGAAIVYEFPAAIAVGLIGIYALWKFRQRPRLIALLAVAGFISLLPLFIQNAILFGSPFFLSYEAYAASTNKAFEAHKHGLLGVTIPLLDPNDWTLFLHNLAEISYTPLRGLFYLNPVLCFVFPGFYFLLRSIVQREYKYPVEAALSLLLFICYFVFNAGFGDSIVYWGGGASFGPRHLIPMLPFLAFPLCEIARRPLWRNALAGFTLLSIFFCLLATSIEPRTPYSPENPLLQYYWPRYLTGRFAETTVGIFSGLPLTFNSVAFNWGKIAQLPHKLELLPLFLVWILIAYRADRYFSMRGVTHRYYWWTLAASVFTVLVTATPYLLG